MTRPSISARAAESLLTETATTTDQDTDRYVFEVLQPQLRTRMKDLKAKMQWTDLVYVPLIPPVSSNETIGVFGSRTDTKGMGSFAWGGSADSLVQLHKQGFTRADIEGSLQGLPVVRIPSLVSLNCRPALPSVRRVHRCETDATT